MTTTTKNLVVLGAGTAGTMVVNKLRRALPTEDWTITVVDRDDIHDYQPGYLFLPFGMNTPEQVRRHKRPLIADGVDARAWRRSTGSTRAASAVHLADGRVLTYDQLVIATGTTPRPDQVAGHARPAVAPRGRRVLHLRGRARAARPARRVQRRSARRAHHRDADQVPRRPAGVHLPGRRLPHQAWSARPHRARLRHPARRRVHQAGREQGARLPCSRRRGSSSSPTSWSSGSTRTAR